MTTRGTVEAYRVYYSDERGYLTDDIGNAVTAAVWSGAHGDMVLVALTRNRLRRWKWDGSDCLRPPRRIWERGSWPSLRDALDDIGAAMRIRFEPVECIGYPCGGECE